MLSFVQKLLEISMCMDKSAWGIIRFLGKLLGIFPVWYSERLAEKIFREGYDPVKRYRKRQCKRRHPGKSIEKRHKHR